MVAPVYFFRLYDGNAVSVTVQGCRYSWCMNTMSRTVALLKPDDLFPAWKWIDIMEECGEIEADEARGWKKGIYGLMVMWGLEPDEVLRTSP